jgi:uncharacterized delta-60 repeat protein
MRRRAPLRFDSLEDRTVPVGELDATFSGDGRASVGLVTRGLTNEEGNALAVQADGKLVVAGDLVAGNSTDFLAAYRYLPDGALDPTFGTNGMALVDAGFDEQGRAVALQPDGKIVIAGSVQLTGGMSQFVVARLNADGTPDATFNADGNEDGVIVITVVGTPASPVFCRANAVTVQADGKIVVAGMTNRPAAQQAFAVVRLTTTGAVDTGFGTNGRQVFDFGGSDTEAMAIALDSAGRIVVGGGSWVSTTGFDFALARLNVADGSLDSTFSGDGKAVIVVGSAEVVAALGFDGSGILAVGNTFTDQVRRQDVAIARLTEAGELDPAFSGDGIQTVDISDGPNPDNFGWAAAVADGQLVVAGEWQGPEDIDFAVARLSATTGALDTTFSGDGKATIDFGGAADSGRGVAIVGGKVVVAGVSSNNDNDFALSRLNADGSLDTTFGVDGQVLTHYGILEIARDDLGHAVLVQPDGKIVVGGASRGIGGGSFLGDPEIALARLNRDGTPDPTFGDTGGVVISDSFAHHALGPYPGGRLLTAGGWWSGFVLTRHDANGNLDVSFGGDGRVETGSDSSWVARALAVLPNGQIVAAGNADADVAVARYQANGQLDTTFHFDGKLTDPAGVGPVVGVVVDATGRITVVGETGLVRFLSNGNRDTSYDGDGIRPSPFAAGALIRDLAVQTDGKLVLAARESNGTDDDFALARVNADGTLDTGFGTGGLLRTDFNTRPDDPAAVRVQADGKIVVAGRCDLAGGSVGYALARYLTNGTLDDTFGTGGKLTGTLGPTGTVAGLFLQPNGKFNVTGSIGVTPNQDFYVLQFRGDNTAPTTPGVSDFTVPQGAPPRTFDLRALFDDLQDTDVELAFEVENTNSGLVGSSLDANDVLTLSFPASAGGTAIITLKATDLDGAITTDSFSVTVEATGVNDPPSFTAGPNQSEAEDAGPRTIPGWATDISPGPDEAGQTVSFHVLSNSNPSLFATAPAIGPNGTLTYTPAANAFGSATLQIVLQDNGGTANGGDDTSDPQVFTISIAPVNDAPSFTAGLDQTVNEDVGPRTVPNWATGRIAGPPNESGQTLSFEIVSNSNPALFAADPAVSEAGVLTYTPAADAHGSATIELLVRDSGGTANGGTDVSATQSFTIAVRPVADAPVAADDDLTANPAVPLAIDVLANDTDADGDVLSVLSFTQPAGGTVVRDGTGLRYTAKAGTFGADSFTYTVSDGNGGTDTAVVSLNVVAPAAPIVQQVRLYYAPNRYEVLTERVPVFAWSRVNRIALVFDQPVSVAQGDLTLTGLAGLVPTAGFDYNAATRTATWTLAPAIGINRLNMQLNGAGVVGLTNGLTMASNVIRQFAVLPGDLDGNGVVTLAEANLVKKNIGKRYPNPRNADVNGDGTVTKADYLIVKGNVGKRV